MGPVISEFCCFLKDRRDLQPIQDLRNVELTHAQDDGGDGGDGDGSCKWSYNMAL